MTCGFCYGRLRTSLSWICFVSPFPPKCLYFSLKLSHSSSYKTIYWCWTAQRVKSNNCFTWRGEPGALLWLVSSVLLPVHRISFLQRGLGEVSAPRLLWSIGRRTAGDTTAPREELFMKSSTFQRVSAPWQVGGEILDQTLCSVIT